MRRKKVISPSHFTLKRTKCVTSPTFSHKCKTPTRSEGCGRSSGGELWVINYAYCEKWPSWPTATFIHRDTWELPRTIAFNNTPNPLVLMLWWWLTHETGLWQLKEKCFTILTEIREIQIGKLTFKCTEECALSALRNLIRVLLQKKTLNEEDLILRYAGDYCTEPD